MGNLRLSVPGGKRRRVGLKVTLRESWEKLGESWGNPGRGLGEDVTWLPEGAGEH